MTVRIGLAVPPELLDDARRAHGEAISIADLVRTALARYADVPTPVIPIGRPTKRKST
jgi:hypothetical protein